MTKMDGRRDVGVSEDRSILTCRREKRLAETKPMQVLGDCTDEDSSEQKIKDELNQIQSCGEEMGMAKTITRKTNRDSLNLQVKRSAYDSSPKVAEIRRPKNQRDIKNGQIKRASRRVEMRKIDEDEEHRKDSLQRQASEHSMDVASDLEEEVYDDDHPLFIDKKENPENETNVNSRTAQSTKQTSNTPDRIIPFGRSLSFPGVSREVNHPSDAVECPNGCHGNSNQGNSGQKSQENGGKARKTDGGIPDGDGGACGGGAGGGSSGGGAGSGGGNDGDPPKDKEDDDKTEEIGEEDEEENLKEEEEEGEEDSRRDDPPETAETDKLVTSKITGEETEDEELELRSIVNDNDYRSVKPQSTATADSGINSMASSQLPTCSFESPTSDGLDSGLGGVAAVEKNATIENLKTIPIIPDANLVNGTVMTLGVSKKWEPEMEPVSHHGPKAKGIRRPCSSSQEEDANDTARSSLDNRDECHLAEGDDVCRPDEPKELEGQEHLPDTSKSNSLPPFTPPGPQDDVGSMRSSALPVRVDVGSLPSYTVPARNDVGSVPSSALPDQDDAGSLSSHTLSTRNNVGSVPSSTRPVNMVKDDVGSVPSSTMPTRNDVGIMPSSIHPARNDVGSVPSFILPVQDDVGSVPSSTLPTSDDVASLPCSMMKLGKLEETFHSIEDCCIVPISQVPPNEQELFGPERELSDGCSSDRNSICGETDNSEAGTDEHPLDIPTVSLPPNPHEHRPSREVAAPRPVEEVDWPQNPAPVNKLNIPLEMSNKYKGAIPKTKKKTVYPGPNRCARGAESTCTLDVEYTDRCSMKDYIRHPAQFKVAGKDCYHGRILEKNWNRLKIVDGKYNRPEQWEKSCRIGRGGQGVCYLAYDLSTNCNFVYKKIKKTDFRENELLLLMDAMDHPGVVQPYGILYHGDCVFILMEYVEGGSLSEYAENCRNMGWPVNLYAALFILRQLLEILLHLKKKNIIHDDIKGRQ